MLNDVTMPSKHVTFCTAEFFDVQNGDLSRGSILYTKPVFVY
jgi:hypothetical protein